jgi:hypothetical protein
MRSADHLSRVACKFFDYSFNLLFPAAAIARTKTPLLLVATLGTVIFKTTGANMRKRQTIANTTDKKITMPSAAVRCSALAGMLAIRATSLPSS